MTLRTPGWNHALLQKQGSTSGRALRFLLIVAAHVALLVGAAELVARPVIQPVSQEMLVHLIKEVPTVPVTQKAKPLPPARHEVLRQPLASPPVLAVASEAPSIASFTVPAQPATTAQAPPTAQVATAATLAHADADYLHNPKPVYPSLSRRQGEEGRVLLHVRVSADGQALAVEIRQSSGSMRLDAAAREAVERWRFVPARQGQEAVESWVLVPVSFSLKN